MADNEQIVALTGLPVSEEMKRVLKRCERGEYVSVEEINATPEMKTAASCVSHQTPTIQLKDREQIEAHVFDILSNYGSVSTDKYGRTLVDERGNTRYNDIVDQGSRLDIVIGLPASGKSSAIVETISKEHHSMLIDNDEAKRLFPEFNKGWGAGVVHAESQMVERDVYLDAIMQGKNIVLPKVGSDANKLLMDYILPAKLQGYKVNVHFVDLDRNKALGRMLNRFINKGRYLAPELIDKYANDRDGNRIAKAYAELADSGMVDGMSKWDNDVGYNELPKLKETKGLSDKFIVDAELNDLTDTKIVEGIRELFDKSGIDTYISDHDIEMQLSIRIDERLNMNYFYEEPESVDDVDYMVILKHAMDDNLTDMQYTLEEIHKAERMIEGGRESLPLNVQDSIVNFEYYAARQESDLNIMKDMYLNAKKKREAIKEAVTETVVDNKENGGISHEGNESDRRNDEEAHTRGSGEFRVIGDGGNDRGSDAQGVNGDKREMGG
ncbi:MAG: zeta toxin family protein, partial [Eubacterium sp.]|nr:zeta toxin family protein [Eubacterium sp.]